MNPLQFLSGKKTYLTSIAIGALLFGQWQNWWKIDQNVYLAMTAAAIAFLRAGVAKGPSDPTASSPPLKPNGEAAVTAGRLPPLTMLAFAILVFCATAFVSGCNTTPQQATYQAVGTTAVSVDTAMTLWGTYVAQSHPPVTQEQAVANAYLKYQNAMAAVCDAGAVYSAAASSTNAPAASLALQGAIANANQEILDLENLIASFGVKLQTTNSTSTP